MMESPIAPCRLRVSDDDDDDALGIIVKNTTEAAHEHLQPHWSLILIKDMSAGHQNRFLSFISLKTSFCTAVPMDVGLRNCSFECSICDVFQSSAVVWRTFFEIANYTRRDGRLVDNNTDRLGNKRRDFGATKMNRYASIRVTSLRIVRFRDY